MFLFESCPPFRSTEPKWFSRLQFFIAIVFSLGLIYYAWNLFEDFVSNIGEPNLYISETSEHFTFPGFKICPKTLSTIYDDSDTINISSFKLYRNMSNSQLYIPSNYSFYDNENHELNPYDFNNSYELYNNSIPKNTNFFIHDHDNNRCRIFTPPSINDESAGIVNLTLDHQPSLVTNELLFIITLDNSSIYNYFEINFDSIIINTTSLTIPSALTNRDPSKDLRNVNTTLVPNQYFITRGQYVIYEIIIKERVSYSSYFSGLFGLKANETLTLLEIKEKELAPIPNALYTALELRFQDNFIIHERQNFQITVTKFISNIGGFYGAVSGIFILLFGAAKLSPWGICQKYVCCWTYRRSFKRNLASRYVSRAGIPLAEDPRELPQGAIIEDRIAILEHLLKEYYIDAYYLEKLRATREKYVDLRNNNLEMLKLLGDDVGDDDSTDGVALKRLEGGSTS